MNGNSKSAFDKVDLIKKSGLTIYDQIEIGDPELWLTAPNLQEILDSCLSGISLKGLPLRSRSKVVKSAICTALGYPIPKSFQKTNPRFVGQRFDVYTQKSNNLQIWNEDLDLSRRYALVRISDDDIILKVKVVSGSDLAPLDTTGTLTQKYQAKLDGIAGKYELVSDVDTEYVRSLCTEKEFSNLNAISPIQIPERGELIPIKDLYDKLKRVVGQSFPDPGSDQERNRGAELHKLVCVAIGYGSYQDNGQFPDIRNQLLEIKLQTSSTIDLGLVSPDSLVPLDMEKIENIAIRHCDVRYAIFYGKIIDGIVTVTNLIVTNGQDFFGRLPKFQGKGLNKKIQIPLKKDYFDS